MSNTFSRLPTLGGLALLATSSFAIACSGDDGGSSTSGSGGTSATSTNGSGGGAGDTGTAPDHIIGTFQVQLLHEREETPEAPARIAVTTVFGRVYEHPRPDDLAWTDVAEAGGCTLRTPEIPFCDPACGSNSICTEGGVCVDYPQSYDLGEVTLSGVATESGDTVTMHPLPPANTYQPLASAGLLYPPFEVGADVTLSVSDGPLGSFEVTTKGIAPLVITSPEGDVPLEVGEPMALEWEAAQNPGQSSIKVKVDISHHGGLKGLIECNVDDNGALEIDADLVSGLFELGFAGFPVVELTRISANDTQTPEGRVALTTFNLVQKYIEIPGLVSCSGNEDCPDGETCQDDLTCG